MDGLFLKDTGVLLRDDENAFLEIQKADFPITLYDRPGLALSNLVLRGDIDAASRAIFSPQTLTPAEMKTFSGELLKGKGKDNPLIKTVTDIFTNPLVILAILMTIKYPMTGRTYNVLEVGRGLRSSAPGPLGSYAQSAFGNLRNLPGAFKTLIAMAKTSGNLLVDLGELANQALISPVRISKDGWLRISAYMQGFHKAEKAGVPIIGGTRMTFQKVYGIAKGRPMWPGLQKLMRPEEIGMAQRLRNWYDKVWKLIEEAPGEGFKKFQEDMAQKGQLGIGEKIGGWIEHYFPVSARYSHLEGEALYSVLQGPKAYHFKMEKVRNMVAGALKKRQGVTIGRISELRRMEQLGMPPVVDDFLKQVGAETAKMETVLRQHWEGVKGITDSTIRANNFAERVLRHMTKSNMNIKARLGSGKIAEGAIRKVADLLGAASRTPERFNAQIKNLAATIVEPAQYGMHPVTATRRYLSTMVSSYTWHIAKTTDPFTGASVIGFKRAVDPLIKAAAGTAGNYQQSYLADQLVPLLRGFKPYNMYKRASTLGYYKNRVYTWLTTHELPKKLLNPSSQKWLKNYFSNYSSLSSEAIGHRLASFFYVSTLGLNLSPAAKNLLQNYITLLHVPGITWTGFRGGMGEMAEKIANYRKHLAELGWKNRDVAFRKAFPDYIEEVGKASGLGKAIVGGDVLKEGALSPIALDTFWKKMQTGMLMPFSTSEAFNRLLGFYVGKHSHLSTMGVTLKTATKMQLAEASELGGMINHICHFPGGPLGMPRALLGISPPLRQFMHFPLRYMGFLMGAPTLTGAKGLARMRPLATAMGGSAAAYVAAKNILGIDLSQGLLMGALPLPQYEKAAFHPWPLVPPIAGIGGAAAKSLVSGEAEQLKRSMALMVPSGIALRRLHKTLGKKYADYQNRLPDGRIPVYNDRRALIGAFTPWQLTMRAVGLSPSSQQAEYGAAKWLLTQREKIRAYRREYLEALSENNINEADRINREFQRAYPELGPLQLKKTDITAVQNRREISRLNRILRGFPKAYQPLFSHIVSQASLSEMTRNIQAQPSTLETYLPLTSSLQ